MISYNIKAGTTDVSVVIRIVDSTDGTPETGVVFNTAGIDLEYRREGEATTDITEATLAALTTTHTDGGFLHIGNGYYRLDLPDAACASGVSGVLVHGTVTGMVVIGCYIQLSAVPADVTHFGGTAGTFSGGRPEVNTTHAAGTAWGSGAITAASIAADAITAAKIADNAIDAGAIAADAITAAKIADGAIDAATFAAGAINAAAIAADAITAAKIADGAIDAATFAAGAINAAAIAADAITDAKVAADVTIASVTGAVGSVTGNVGGNVAGSVGSVTGNVGGNVTGSVGSLAAQAKADVNAEVVDGLATDTYAEPGQGVPAATTTLAAKIGYLYKAWRNRHTQTSTEYALYGDDAVTKDQEAVVSDDGTTFERGEIGTGA